MLVNFLLNLSSDLFVYHFSNQLNVQVTNQVKSREIYVIR